MTESRKIEVIVDKEMCFSFGLCLEAAPHAFEWDENEQAVPKPVGPEDLAAVRAAAEACPRSAITVVEHPGD